MNVELIDKQQVFQGYFKIYRYQLRHSLFNGGKSAPVTRELFDRGHAVAVLPYDPVLDNVLLIEQFRIGAYATGVNPWLLEIVAGIIEEGESIETVAQRESLEETGCQIQQLVPIYSYLVSPGAVSEHFDIFCGTIDSRNAGGVFGEKSEQEDIKVHVLSADEALHKLAQGEIQSSSAIIALQWLALNRDKLRQADNGRAV
jgi:ADP-ribose pyrophosphatase